MTAVVHLDHDRIWLQTSDDIRVSNPVETSECGTAVPQPSGRRRNASPLPSPPATTPTTNQPETT